MRLTSLSVAIWSRCLSDSEGQHKTIAFKSTVFFMNSVTGLSLSSLLPFSVDLRWPIGILIRAADDFFLLYLNFRSWLISTKTCVILYSTVSLRLLVSNI